MSTRKSILVLCSSIFFTAAVVVAQTSGPTAAASVPAVEQAVPEGGVPTYVVPESPKDRQARVGAEDPGMNPAPKKRFWRFGKFYHIERFDRVHAEYDQPQGFVRPFGAVNAAFELYQHNDKYVWVWVPEPDPNAAPQAPETAPDPYNDATYAFLNRVRPQYTPLAPPESVKKIRFVESSKGLPAAGSWRNSGAVVDMNGDKCPDIIAPPERKGNGFPAIFLGDCAGNWRFWSEASYPLRLDYGSVVAADFNKDGHNDLAFAVHLNGVYVFLGDGKGKFKDASKGLPRDFPTRRLVATDVDRDGDADLVVSSEGPTGIDAFAGPAIRTFINNDRATKWEQVAVVPQDAKVGADWLSVGNFNGDRYPDLVLSSAYFGTMELVYLSSAPKKWKAVDSDGDLLPSLSYYYASTVGKFTARDRDDAIISYVRFWPNNANPQRVAPPKLNDLVNIDRLSFANGKVKRHSIARWVGRGIGAIGSGDFDRDGNLDIVYVKTDAPSQVVILLGDGKGGFEFTTIDDITVPANPIYDVKVADFNKDGRPDLMLMYESGGKSFVDRTGSIRVYLGTGSERPSPVAQNVKQ